MKKKYEDLRENIITWDLFFTASNAMFSKLIRFFTKSEVSHVWIFVWALNRLFIVEALEGKWVIISLASNRVTREKCWHGRTSLWNHSINEIEDILSRELGGDYDLIWAVLSLFIDTGTSKNFCSELAAKAHGIEFPLSRRGITPIDIVKTCNKVEEIIS